MIIVYALSSLRRKFIYVGMTNDLNKRIQQHNAGQNRSTKPFIPFKLLYSEQHPDRISARVR
ncbi:MAG: GIY-YIG nuclease family protein [Cyclobacteriaceae bacterium]